MVKDNAAVAPGDSWRDDGIVRGAMDDGFRVLIRIPVSVVVSAFLFTYVGFAEGLAWLLAMFALEGAAMFVSWRLARGDLRFRAAHVVTIFLISLLWVVHAALLWREGGEVPRIAALMDLFTISLYGAIGGHKDLRLMLALMGAPLVALAVMLMTLLWSTATPFVATFASLATLGACATIVANGFAMYRSDRQLCAALVDLDAERNALEARVSQRTRELSQALEAARSADVAKSRFLATVSHELRTPLNAIIGYAELLRETLEASRSEAEAVDAGRIATAGNGLLAIVDDILDLSQIEAGRIALDPRLVDGGPVLESVVTSWTHLARANRNNLTLVGADQASAIRVDARRFQQCLLNLVGNACKFTQDGEVRVEVRRNARTIEVAVRDTGVGIAAEDVERIFEPFTQVDADMSRRFEGAGLGLAITRRLARLMGGDVTVQSKPQVGSVFTLALPA